ncbi:DUF4848 domain-containing protein [Tenacibaculum jejuense]|uniref:Probable lipoprotein n=1 Tax=Tenacibaculum jejuense TaxID=584609 RepID=A0A238UBV9_9FLAO|nr:DUF4848 domain-containing protein [Tenacibaculum jejuense]SNR16058.1 Probable lipoprotein precursor [Tenacibaculum jejuense]
MKKNFQLLLLLLVLIVYSCSNELENEESLNDALVKVEDGILVFKDTDVFTSQLETLHSMSDEERIAWLTEIGFNNSLYLKTKDLTLDELHEKNYINVPDDIFATILNKDGVYIVGEEAHKIGHSEELITNKNNIKNNELAWLNKDNLKSYAIDFGNDDNSLLKREDLQKTEPYDGDFFNLNGTRANLGVTHLSAHLIGWNRGYVGYASVGIKIKGRKKKRRKWKDDEMWFAGIAYEAWVIGDFANRHTLGFVGEDRKKSVQKTLFWKAGGAYFGARIEAAFTYEDDGYPRVVSDTKVFLP